MVSAYLGNKSYIFISYAHKDDKLVKKRIQKLQIKYNVWYDEGILVGENTWSRELIDRIKGCSLFFSIITNDSLASKNCFNERICADDNNILIINFVLNGINKKSSEYEVFKFEFGRYQFIELGTTDDAIDKAISDFERKITNKELLKRLKDDYEDVSTSNTPEVVAEDPEELCKLGDKYYKGDGVKIDYANAFKYYEKSAKLGNAGGQNGLGNCYCYGRSVKKDYAEAVKWYRKSADQGNASAQLNLGFCYDNGYGVTQDLTEAVKWYRKSADLGNATAQCNLGNCYRNGWGVTKDLTEAVKWYRKSADQGNAIAQRNLGDCYLFGKGVTKDLTEAVKWYKKSADQGNTTAQSMLKMLNQQ